MMQEVYDMKPQIIIEKMADEHFEDCIQRGEMITRFHNMVAMAA
jgi:hypothetical protein